MALLPGATRNTRVLNLGLPGGTSEDGLANGYLDRISRYRADAAIVEFCINDANTAHGISTTESKDNAQDIIDALRTANADILIFMLITNNCVSGSAPALARPNLSTYYQGYRDMVTADNTLHLIDPSWGTANGTNLPDGLHPTAAHWSAVAIPEMVDVMAPLLLGS